MLPQYAQPFEVVQLKPERLEAPLRWRKPRKVFVNSVSDLFHEDVPDAFIDRVFAVMALTPQHTYQILTKRAERMRAYVSTLYDRSSHATVDFEAVKLKKPVPNVWLGVSVENQRFANERIPLLLQTPAAIRFISAEPLLEQTDLHLAGGFCRACLQWTAGSLTGHCFDPKSPCFAGEMAVADGIDWVIVGGESGPGARPFDPAWARSIVQQCKAAGVPVFVKQLGAHVRGDLKGCLLDQREMPDGSWRTLPAIVTPAAEAWVAETRANTIGGKLYDKKGGDPSEWPVDLRVRKFPRGGQR